VTGRWIFGTSFLLLVFLTSCEGDRIVPLSSAYGDRVFVAQDRETMESLIDSFITGKRSDGEFIRLLSSQKVFSVGAGRKVLVLEGGYFARTKKVRVLEGRHKDDCGWVYEVVLRK
jgi:hypothetical protein